MSPVFDCRDEAQLLAGMRQARQAIGRGELVVLPTDTVYGVAADAFSARAVAAPARCEGPRTPVAAARAGRRHRDPARAGGRGARGRRAARRGVLAGRADDRAAVAAVAVVGSRRDARHRGGPHAGQPPRARAAGGDRPARRLQRQPHRQAAAITASDAQDMLGDSVAVYLDGGPSATGVASTIIDATSLVIGGAAARARAARGRDRPCGAARGARRSARARSGATTAHLGSEPGTGRAGSPSRRGLDEAARPGGSA